jgi:hypothetical protein
MVSTRGLGVGVRVGAGDGVAVAVGSGVAVDRIAVADGNATGVDVQAANSRHIIRVYSLGRFFIGFLPEKYTDEHGRHGFFF